MNRINSRILWLGSLLVASLSLISLSAGATGLSNEVTGFTARHGVTPREIRLQLGSRNIRRVFVPLTNREAAWDFAQTFTQGKGLILMARAIPAKIKPYNHYVRLLTSAEKIWASAYDNEVGPSKSGEQVKQNLIIAKGSRLVVLEVGQQAVNHAEQFLTRRHRTGNYTTDIESYKRAIRRAGFTAGNCAADCMWWLPNLETGPGQNVMQLLGTKRTAGPQEMPALAIHSAKSSVVQVIGVGAIGKPDLLVGMSEQELMGKPPSRGTPAENVR